MYNFMEWEGVGLLIRHWRIRQSGCSPTPCLWQAGPPHISAGMLNGAPYSSHQHPTAISCSLLVAQRPLISGVRFQYSPIELLPLQLHSEL